jgi:hypothetical protein
MMPRKDGDARAEGCDLRKRQVHENDFPANDVEAEIDKNSRQNQTGQERPHHGLEEKCHLP